MTGSTLGLKTMRRKSIQYEGVKLVNVLPTGIRNFVGKLENFKSLLDKECSEDRNYYKVETPAIFMPM